ncbi:retrovirus-related pol polyprotein from transposon TNT 1-94 [Tanacetum coccineum]
MEILVKTCLMPLALKTQNDSFAFVHELKQEMHADLKYVESLEDELDELESDKAEFSNMYDMLLQECVSKDVMCSYLQSSSDLDEITELQCLYLHKDPIVMYIHRPLILLQLYKLVLIQLLTLDAQSNDGPISSCFMEIISIDKGLLRPTVSITILSRLVNSVMGFGGCISEIYCFVRDLRGIRLLTVSWNDLYTNFSSRKHFISSNLSHGTEFLNKTLNAFFKEEGIEHQTSTPRTPEQNMKEKGDSCILVGYPLTSKGYRVYNKRTQLIVESIHLRFDEIKEISETSVANDTSGLVLQRQTASDYDNPDPAPELQNVFLQRYNSSHQTGLKVLLRKRVLISKESFAQLSSLGGCQDFAEGYVDNQYGLLIPDHPDKVYGLRKALYGLKQAREGLLDVKSRTVLTMSSAELEYVGVICTLCSGNVDAGTASRFHGFNSTRYRLYCDFSVSHLGNIMQPRAALPTEYQLADMFTKALPEDRFQYLVRQIGMRCLTLAELEVLTKESA